MRRRSSDVPRNRNADSISAVSANPLPGQHHNLIPVPVDFDGDGRLTELREWSVYPYYVSTALAMSHRPQYTIELIHGDDSANSKVRICVSQSARLPDSGGPLHSTEIFARMTCSFFFFSIPPGCNARR
jgi:hypothetical protein